MDLRALRSCLANFERENEVLKVDKEALKCSNKDLMVIVAPSAYENKNRCLDDLVETIFYR